MRFDVHSLFQIETMCVESLHAGEKSDVVALLGSCEIDDPIEQLTAVPLRSVTVLCYEVIDL